MTFTLHLGVVELPYAMSQPPETKRAVTKSRRGRGPIQTSRRSANAARTTGDVASILEAKYHVMEIFAELHNAEIGAIIVQFMEDHIENILMGAPDTGFVFPQEGFGEIQKLFVAWINSRGMDGIFPGVPTRAALRGVNHRMKKPYAKRASRPSFRDTGLYMQAFRAWMSQQ